MISIILTKVSNLVLEYWEIQKVFTARKREHIGKGVVIYHNILALSPLFRGLYPTSHSSHRLSSSIYTITILAT